MSNHLTKINRRKKCLFHFTLLDFVILTNFYCWNVYDIIRRGSESRRIPTRESALPQTPLGSNQSYIEEDDRTFGGKSQKTFQTLDKLYTQENRSYQSDTIAVDNSVISEQLKIATGRIEDKRSLFDDHDEITSQHSFFTKLSDVDPDENYRETDPSGPRSISQSSVLSDFDIGETPKAGLNRKVPLRQRSTSINSSENSDCSISSSEYSFSPSVAASSLSLQKSPTSHPKSRATVYRVITVPPGKLGVVIDTTTQGPTVYEVKSGSPLENKIQPGERIIAIDDVDTSKMSASAVTKVMTRNMEMQRKITVASRLN